MFVLRQAVLDDASTLLKLAKMVHFINLPADLDIIRSKIVRSRKSFLDQCADERERMFMFVLEDTESGNVVGTSSMTSCISWPGKPHTYFHVRRREHYSEDLQEGHVHVTLQLCADESGPTEIGGLILFPVYRGHKEKLGQQLSLVRFHYMGLHRQQFSQRIIAEMMGALTPDSSNLLWEYLGRKFINLNYTEADRFCQHSKEFMTSLFPKSEIYASLLPPEARNLIGKVGPETRPARAMLEQLGFQYKGHVDPFDGGPYLEARLDEVALARDATTGVLADPGPPRRDDDDETYPRFGFISGMSDTGYRAVRAYYRHEDGHVTVEPAVAEALQIEPGETIGVTALPDQPLRRTGGSSPITEERLAPPPPVPSRPKATP